MIISELRNGNYVKLDNQISDVNHVFVAVEVINARHGTVGYRNKKTNKTCTVLDCLVEPVAITPKWLEKLGIKHIRTHSKKPMSVFRSCEIGINRIVVCVVHKPIKTNILGDWALSVFDGNCRNVLVDFRVSYIHELQNLIYDLTCETLEIKL